MDGTLLDHPGVQTQRNVAPLHALFCRARNHACRRCSVRCCGAWSGWARRRRPRLASRPPSYSSWPRQVPGLAALLRRARAAHCWPVIASTKPLLMMRVDDEQGGAVFTSDVVRGVCMGSLSGHSSCRCGLLAVCPAFWYHRPVRLRPPRPRLLEQRACRLVDWMQAPRAVQAYTMTI